MAEGEDAAAMEQVAEMLFEVAEALDLDPGSQTAADAAYMVVQLDLVFSSERGQSVTRALDPDQRTVLVLLMAQMLIQRAREIGCVQHRLESALRRIIKGL